MTAIDDVVTTGRDAPAFVAYQANKQLPDSAAQRYPIEGAPIPTTGWINATKLPRSIIEKHSYCCTCKRIQWKGFHHCSKCTTCHTPGQHKDHENSNNKPSSNASPNIFGTGSGHLNGGKPTQMAFSMSSSTYTRDLDRDSIIKDGGASDFIFNHPKWFLELVELEEAFPMSTASGLIHLTMGGTVSFITTRKDGTPVTVVLQNAKYSPQTPCNLVGDGQLKKIGYVFDGMSDTIINATTREELCSIRWLAGVSVFPCTSPVASTNSASGFLAGHPILPAVEYSKLHRRFMHAGPRAIHAHAKKLGITVVKEKGFRCEDCLENRLHEVYGERLNPKYTQPGQLIRFDAIVFEEGFNGYRYCVHFIDMAPNQHWVRFARDKDEIFSLIEEFTVYFERQSGRKLQAYGCDNGPEFALPTQLFRNSRLKRFTKARGIALYLSIPYSPWMNGKSEKARFDLVQKAKTAHNAAGLPHFLWPFTMQAAYTVLNVLPCSANEDFKSPYQAMADALNLPQRVVPTGGFLHIIGSEVWVHIKKEYRKQSNKFAKTGIKMRLLAWDSDNGKIIWAWDPKKNQVHRAVAVKIFEEDGPVPDDPIIADIEYVAEISAISVDEAFKNFTDFTTTLERAPTSSPIEDAAQNDELPVQDTIIVATEGTQEAMQQHTPEPTPESENARKLQVHISEGSSTPLIEDVPDGVTPEEIIAEEGTVLPPSRGRGRGRGTRWQTMPTLDRSHLKREATTNEGRERFRGKRAFPNVANMAVERNDETPLEHLSLSALKAQYLIDTVEHPNAPKGWKDAQRSPDFETWRKAAEEAIHKLELQETFIWAKPDKEARVLPSK